MRRESTLYLLVVLLLWGCGEGSGKDSDSKAETTAKSGFGDKGKSGTDSVQNMDHKAADGGLGAHDEGTVRPTGIVVKEATLKKPKFSRPAPDRMLAIPGGSARCGGLGLWLSDFQLPQIR